VGVHAGQDPELKELLQGGELNLVSCPECGHVAYHESFLIYQDPAAELLAYVYPEAQRAQEPELRKIMLAGFGEAQAMTAPKERLSYEPILLFGLEELIELLQKEESYAEQSQIAQELCRQNEVQVALLSPAHARRLDTVRVIPHTGIHPAPTRIEILAGIDRLLKIDPVLDIYKKLHASIQADPAWSL
jgi:hypothetical protein